MPLLTGAATSVREWAVGGYYGGWVNVTDGVHKYLRGPVGENLPLSMWSNRWSTMPVHVPGFDVTLPMPDGRARLDTMPGTSIPVIRQPFAAGDQVPFWANRLSVDRHFWFDLDVDPDEQENRVGESGEAAMIDLLRAALDDVEAPADQYTRLGLT